MAKKGKGPVWQVPQAVRDALDLMSQRDAGSSTKQFSFHWGPELEMATRRAAADAMLPVGAFIRETLAARLLGDHYLNPNAKVEV